MRPNVAENISGMGGSITIMEGLPDGISCQEVSPCTLISMALFVIGLSPGLYSISVFMEDKDFQESTFRPDSIQRM